MTRKTVDDLLQEARERLVRLTPTEALAAMQRGEILVDTRCSEDLLHSGTIPGAVHVPLSVLEWQVDPTGTRDPHLARAERLILLCNHGFSSSLAAARLHDLGLTNSTDVIGGFEAWRAAGLPVVAGGVSPGTD